MSPRAPAGPLQAQRWAALAHLDQLITRSAGLPVEMPRADLPGWVSEEIQELLRLLYLPRGVTRRSEDARRVGEARTLVEARTLLEPLWFVFRPLTTPEQIAKGQGWLRGLAARPDDPVDVRAAIERLKTAADLLRGDRPVGMA